jgi:hypothetical protein
MLLTIIPLLDLDLDFLVINTHTNPTETKSGGYATKNEV